MAILKTPIYFLLLTLLCAQAWAASPAVRIKDIARVLEARENQLLGFGLVAGLRNTGDSYRTEFTKQALTNLLNRLGLPPQGKEFKSRNVASVMVTADLSPFIKPGERCDVTVSSLGDATSLQGGTLLLTPLEGPDGEVYAVAQGPVSVGGISDSPFVVSYRRGPATVGRIPNGALVERTVPVSLAEENVLTIVLNKPDFTTATRVAYTIVKQEIEARAMDAATIMVPFSEEEDPVELMAEIESLTVVPDVTAKVVINERTGTIVIGEWVRLAPVAVTYRSINVIIGEMGEVVGGEAGTKLVKVSPGESLGDLIKALNAVGATPQDLIAILQCIKEAGALSGELEII